MRILIEKVLTVTMHERGEIDHCSILIEDGRIERVSRNAIEKMDGDHVIDGSRMIAIPGLINGHVHCDITLARGLGDGLTLFEQDNQSWVSRKKWYRNELNREARHYSRMLQYAEAVKGGTTFICDVPFWWYGDDLTAPFREVGIVGAVVLDYRRDFLTGELAEKREYFDAARQLQDEGHMPIVEAPAEEGFEDELLLRLMSWAQELDTLLHLHLAETTWRMESIRARFNSTPVRYLRDLGFLNERVIGSHGVYLNEADRKILHTSGSRIVNCPAAEMKIADGIAPVSELVSEGIPVGLGTDGALWNDSSDLFAEMKTLMLLQRVLKGADSLSAHDSLHAATLGGAQVFGLENELGSIEEGKAASLVLLNCDRPHLTPLHRLDEGNVLQLITSSARASDVDTVIVDGKIIVEGGVLLTIDEEALMAKCQELADRQFT
ncbi:MAG: amidohydrolase family protein [Spirochaetes bacterium]|nr:amidohydrolase family protein [Spirochaetota bacterium]